MPNDFNLIDSVRYGAESDRSRTVAPSSTKMSDNYRWDFAHGVASPITGRSIKPPWQQNFARDYHHFLSSSEAETFKSESPDVVFNRMPLRY